jgi:hypothetical protein
VASVEYDPRQRTASPVAGDHAVSVLFALG